MPDSVVHIINGSFTMQQRPFGNLVVKLVLMQKTMRNISEDFLSFIYISRSNWQRRFGHGNPLIWKQIK